MAVAERVAALLFAFKANGEPRSVSELACAVGREKTQVSRMLKSMEQGGLVVQDPQSKRYTLAWGLRVLAGSAGNNVLARVCVPALRKLVAYTGEAALLSVQESTQSLTVLREESHQSLQAGGWVGRRSPLHCTASGRALLFDSADEEVDFLTRRDIGRSEYGTRTPGDLSTLLERLRNERERGYSVASEEVEIGLTSIGVPVRDSFGAINVSGPTSRLRAHKEDTGGLLLRTAHAVHQELLKIAAGKAGPLGP
ncbi:IclR family transcriptional regulator [Corynebacterium flavescens]|uniref:IclR family transcriptional regulator n=1 Tax=Corynebacterium flavescens TaxID=28028 RepID=UPI0028A08336|nr:IclR family transcriptional regulator [Corynebacterium flavescens]